MNGFPLRAPKPGSVFRRHRERLALFHRSAGQESYWSAYWSENMRSRQLRAGLDGELDEFEAVISAHVKPDLPVLDAGCGPAQFVAALKRRGYRTVGVDYDPDIVAYVNRECPELDVRRGDIRTLEIASGTIGCYLSLGVVEHFEEGPEQALREARRVLHPRGVALISVPFLNPPRQAHLESLRDSHPTEGEKFHQYYFSESDFGAVLKKAGLETIDHFPYGITAFFQREHPVVSRLWGARVLPDRVKDHLRGRWRRAPIPVRLRYGHMLMLVCRPV